MKQLKDILVDLKTDKLTVESAYEQILSLSGKNISTKKIVEEKPEIVGHLNKPFGYKGYKEIEVGTEVYSFKDTYYFEMIPLNGGKPTFQKFYKETLTPCIKFLK